MLLPSAEDLCIFDIKFLLSSRLLSCWLFLTRRPRSPNFPIFNAGRAHPRPQTSFAPPQLNSVGLLLLACAVCTVLELQCAALSPSCTLKPTEQCSPLKNVLLFTNWVAPVHSGSGLAHGRLDIIFNQSGGFLSSSTSPLNCAYFNTTIICVPVVVRHSLALTRNGGPYLRHIWRPCGPDKPPSAAQLAN